MRLSNAIALACFQASFLAHAASAINELSSKPRSNQSLPPMEVPAARTFESVQHELNITFWVQYLGLNSNLKYSVTVHTVPEFVDTSFYCNDDWRGDKWYDFVTPPWHGMSTLLPLKIRLGNICVLNKDATEWSFVQFETYCANCFDRTAIAYNRRHYDVPTECGIYNLYRPMEHGRIAMEARCQLRWTTKKE